MHPNKLLIGVAVKSDNRVLLALRGQTGIGDDVTSAGLRATESYSPVDGLGWAVAIQTPYSHIYELTSVSTISVFAIMSVCVLFGTVLLQGSHVYWVMKRRGMEGESP